MKKVIFFSLFLSTTLVSAQNAIEEKTEYYHFRINYWFNMHHLLKHESFLNSEMDSTALNIDLPYEARENLRVALDYYVEQFKGKNLRTDPYLEEFKVWISEIQTIPNDIPDKFATHVQVLQEFSDTYAQYFWSEHQSVCTKALNKYLPTIKNTEKDFWDSMFDKTKAFTLDDIVKVDVVYYGSANKWNTRDRPYTTIFPTRVVMASRNYAVIEGEWLELLFHESAHALILSRSGFVGGTIQDVAKNMDIAIPRQLYHAYLFYITGYYAQKLLQQEGLDYPTTYMQNKRVFSRYHEELKMLDEYLEGQKTLAHVTRDILEALTR